MNHIVDAHHHFWRYNLAEQPWIGPGMERLQQDFLPSHLEIEIRAAGIQGTVAVQARQTLEETCWLLDLAIRSPFIKGVVGWAPIADKGFPAHLERLAEHTTLKALRHVVQDEADDAFLSRRDFNNGIASLASTGLVYDILIRERQMPQAIEFVDRHPYQTFVLDHIAKPQIRQREVEPWRTNLQRLAERGNVCCKLSGLVTEADWKTWTPQQLRPYFEIALESFGPERLMAGSDWPVCLLATDYRRWWDTVQGWIDELSPAEQAQVLGETATRIYRLEWPNGKVDSNAEAQRPKSNADQYHDDSQGRSR